MPESVSGSSETPKLTVDALLTRADGLRGYKTLQKSPAKLKLFPELVRQALKKKEFASLLDQSEAVQNKFLTNMIATVNSLTEEQIAAKTTKNSKPKKADVVSQETGQRVQDVVQSKDDDVIHIRPVQNSTDPTHPTQFEGVYDVQFVDNLVNASAQGITFGDVQVNNQVPEFVYVGEVKTRSGDARNTVPENDGLTALRGLNLDGTDFRSLNHEQQVAFANMIAFARRKGWTTEKLNDDRAKLMDAIAKAKEVTAPSRSGSSSEWTNRHTAIATAATLIFGIPLAVGVLSGGAYLLSDKDKPSPAVAPAQGVTTADMPRASKEVTSIGGGFTAVRRNGQFELKSEHGNLPIQVTFVSDEGESVVTQGLMSIPGTNTYVFNTGASKVRVKYRDMSTNGVYETKVVEVK